MGNYKNIEIDFIERTLELITQYEKMMFQYEFEKQFNHTLLINCLLGLIVFPKERTISYLPKQFIGEKIKEEIGIINSYINPRIKNMKELIVELRHSIAHFSIVIESTDDRFLVDRIVFRDRERDDDYVVATFIPSELMSFIRYYSKWLVENIRKYKLKLILQGSDSEEIFK